MEITRNDAKQILFWADVTERESMLDDKSKLIDRIKEVFPTLESEIAEKGHT